MHRQSLGSPASKLHNNHGVLFSIAGAGVIKDEINNAFNSDDHRKDKIASCSAGSTADDDEYKSQKPYQQKSTLLLVSSSSRLVHLIPLLTFLCFLILYLSSHDPSRRDLAPFTGFKTLSSKKSAIDSNSIDIDNIGVGSLEIQKTDVLAIRSMRNLQQQERHRLHRKFGH